jgi:serine/threonine protein kinase
MEKSRRSRSHRSLGGRAPACSCEDDAARILRVLLLAMAYLHARDIVRRDIKPENILFAEQDGRDGNATPTSSVQVTDLTRYTS